MLYSISISDRDLSALYLHQEYSSIPRHPRFPIRRIPPHRVLANLPCAFSPETQHQALPQPCGYHTKYGSHKLQCSQYLHLSYQSFVRCPWGIGSSFFDSASLFPSDAFDRQGLAIRFIRRGPWLESLNPRAQRPERDFTIAKMGEVVLEKALRHATKKKIPWGPENWAARIALGDRIPLGPEHEIS